MLLSLSVCRIERPIHIEDTKLREGKERKMEGGREGRRKEGRDRSRDKEGERN
jgi:hypothetical protein